jgi:hypothetical protein
VDKFQLQRDGTGLNGLPLTCAAMYVAPESKGVLGFQILLRSQKWKMESCSICPSSLKGPLFPLKAWR